jgi:hypothetical protein
MSRRLTVSLSSPTPTTIHHRHHHHNHHPPRTSLHTQVLVEEVDPRDLARQAEEQRALEQARVDQQVRLTLAPNALYLLTWASPLSCECGGGGVRGADWRTPGGSTPNLQFTGQTALCQARVPRVLMNAAVHSLTQWHVHVCAGGCGDGDAGCPRFCCAGPHLQCGCRCQEVSGAPRLSGTQTHPLPMSALVAPACATKWTTKKASDL